MENWVDLSHPDNSELVRGRSLIVEAAWCLVGLPLLCCSLPLPRWARPGVLRLFGAKVADNVYIKPSVRVKFPWYLEIGKNSWIGEEVWIDNLAFVKLGSDCCVSQGAYLCTGNHDWTVPNMRLFKQPITLGAGSWVGAQCVVCPGVEIGEGAVIAAGSVVRGKVSAWEVHGGNPCVFLRHRVRRGD
jgi:putative colanic acid biosynthesis acetyltransferase WcaF